ncbi:MAG: prolyl oligopeptidase family serine peptidase [Gemmatimonadales bacterium]|nr:prolyl oligopeptidase family serine peptidase [Gemmatimonadales bacterium]
MRPLHRLALLLAAAPAAPAVPLAAQLTLDRVVTSLPITGRVPTALAWSADGGRLAFAWDSAGGPVREVWLVQRDGSGRRPLTRFGATPATGGARELAWRRDGTALLVLRGDQLLDVDAATGESIVLATVGATAGDLTLAPTGRHAAYVKDGDLWVVPLDGTAPVQPRRLTRVALPGISTAGLGTYARMDREIGPATWASGAPTHAWSPDGRLIAAHLVDRRDVQRVPFPHYLGAETQPNEVRRSYPGGVNEVRQLVLVDVLSASMETLPFETPTEVQVVNFAWSPLGVLLVDRESDDATRRWVHVVRPGDTPRLVYSDQRDSRIYTSLASTWSRDGQHLLLTADRDDRYRVYRVPVAGGTPEAVTPAGSDAEGAAWPLPDGQLAWIANAPDPAERHLWRGQPGGTVERVTQRPGTHRVVVAPDGRTAADLFTDDLTPPHLLLVPMAGGPDVVVTAPGGPELASVGLVAPRYVRLEGADPGSTLRAKVWLPAAARRGEKVPVLFGPVYSNTVRNRWGGTYGLLQQLLVQKGYAVVQVDVRGSTGYGRAFREAFLFEWGGRDLDDLAAVKRWLGAEAWADTARTGIFGSSYGGLITVYSLFRRPGLFKAGVAGAAAVDPRFFGSDDVAITRRPQTHPAAFRRGALQYAGGLQDRLMLIHGMMDDVVPFKTIADLAEELMRQGKEFDLVVAPGATHGWTQRPHHATYLLGKLVQHFERWVPVAR